MKKWFNFEMTNFEVIFLSHVRNFLENNFKESMI